ncbi:MAG: sigma-70 family RNA polymerase sigma factor [Chloroflexia bacterium]|nr:sigma-70 family RNA polymerase sigma factor [Chloroflexia bacterium]
MAEMASGDDVLLLFTPFQRELLAHCYRMLGSIHDAEDMVQVTFLRAWRSYDRFEGRSSLRTWLYRIATNVCLSAIEEGGRRPMPSALGGPNGEPERPVVPAPEMTWLEPIPDALFVDGAADPAAIVVSRESMRLAFIAALQHLPAKQRAVLILRDVLSWRANEVAELLDTTTAAINSALQRARAQLEQVAPSADKVEEPADPDRRALLDRYVAAFERADVPAITQLLRDDVVWEMPPFTAWFVGADAVGRLIAAQCPAGPDDSRMIATNANGQPAFALYIRRADGIRHAHSLQVLTLSPAGVAHVGAFFDRSLFATFGLPLVHPSAVGVAAAR